MPQEEQNSLSNYFFLDLKFSSRDGRTVLVTIDSSLMLSRDVTVNADMLYERLGEIVNNTLRPLTNKAEKDFKKMREIK